ncbi:hypothetical protein GCM10010171_08800 [Actinokineospora fastidiosa]|uniref:Barstar (barnase inhibitor) domain-containing protein n=1 Tax=Actinokineospora fastidiosa TaxID=1816 RepID=A0A918L7Q5_9PSEU|nr:hypothetical protein GCM10010171_08800 [Actinokineospora fastidiosa]
MWLDVGLELPWLRPRPYFVDRRREAELTATVARMGFKVIEADVRADPETVEEDLLVELTRLLEFNELGAGSWAAFEDRLWDLLCEHDKPGVAVIIRGLDGLVGVDLYRLVRCVHKLVSMTEGVGLADAAASRQVEYFFVGEWGAS